MSKTELVTPRMAAEGLSMVYEDELGQQNAKRLDQMLFARYAAVMGLAKGHPAAARDIAYQKYTKPDGSKFTGMDKLEKSIRNAGGLEALIQKAAIEAADTTTSGWALQATRNPAMGAFLDLIRARTIVDRIPNVRRVPMNVSVPVESASTTFAWVGEGFGKPVGKLTFASTTVLWSKVSGITVLTRELLKQGTAEAEAIIRNDLTEGAANFIDTEFLDEGKAQIDYITPGGIIYNVAMSGVTAGTSAANFRTDVKTLLAALNSTVKDLRGTVLLMNPTSAVNLSLMDAAFSGLGADGGTIAGLTVLTSSAVGNRLIALHGPSLLLADAGVELATSDQTSLELDTQPVVSDASPVSLASNMKSLFQYDLQAFRVDRFVCWKMARAGCVKWISGANYGA